MLCTTLPASLQTRGEKTKTIAIEPQAFNNVTSSATENEDVAGERLLVQHGLHLRTEPIEAAAHVRDTCRNPDLRPCRKLDHWRRLSWIDRKSTASAPLSTLINARPGSSM